MLVLTRQIGEEIVIGGQIRVKVVAVQGKRVRLGIVAPDDVRVDRLEICLERNEGHLEGWSEDRATDKAAVAR